jgi:hypothetical protein
MTYKQNLNQVWKEIKLESVNYNYIIKNKVNLRFRLRDSQKYSGVGRPRNIDYIYFLNNEKFEQIKSRLFVACIGSPIDLKIPVPNIMEAICG